MESGEKVGIIGRNGAGKTTLMKIIAGLEFQDEGSVVFNNAVRFEYLDQMPDFPRGVSPLEYVLSAKPELYELIDEYNTLLATREEFLTDEGRKRLHECAHKIDEARAWDYESEAKSILSRLGITEFDESFSHYSGGMKKRVALARALVSRPDLLIMDEPTNHLDADSVQWLQDYLSAASLSLLFVTHDRYFLDSLATRIVELEQEKLFSYPGNYELYLERKEAMAAARKAEYEHSLSRLRMELAWLQKGAKARRTKAKSKIDWIEELRKNTKLHKEKDIKIELGKITMTGRIIDAYYIGKQIAGKRLFKDFTYVAKPRDRYGIIGPNGCGKSTLLNVLAGMLPPDEGKIAFGQTINIGFFRQEISDLKESMTVIGAVREIAEYIDVGEGRDRYLTARDLLEKFLFPRNRYNTLVETLSGGERKRLALIRILMRNPNVLLLDEPTNDFDIQTLTALEEYLEDFLGVLLIVSHDRSFLDRTVEFIWSFDGSGNIREYPGNYSDYLARRESEQRAAKSSVKEVKEKPEKRQKPEGKPKKLSYALQREFDELERKIPELESEQATLESRLHSGEVTDYKEFERLGARLAELGEEIDSALARWMELSEATE
ncbi:MAG: ABC-F family ATP-binding cassette domain-containing protein [Chloroflexota bacterium]